MKRTVIFSLLLLCLFFPIAASAAPQDSLARIQGVVNYEINSISSAHNVAAGCSVQIFFEKGGGLDSLYTMTASDGRFSFKGIPVGRIVMKIRCIGFETNGGVYELAPGDNAFFFTLKEKIEELQQAKVEADIPLMKQLRDTTVFNTKAISTRPGDELEQVLSRIPGFTITDKDIYVNGEKVARTYVNGRLIFGDKTVTAIKSLKADEVTQVKVYDERLWRALFSILSPMRPFHPMM